MIETSKIRKQSEAGPDLPAASGREVIPDPSFSPQEDFYAHVNAEWQRNNPIPQGRRFWNIFHIRLEEVKHQVREILDDWSRDGPEVEDNQRKAADFHLALVNKEQHIGNSAEALEPILKEIQKMSHRELPSLLGRLSSLGVDHFLKYDCGRHVEGHSIGRLAIDNRFGSPDFLFVDSETDREHLLAVSEDCQAAGLPFAFKSRNLASIMEIERSMMELFSTAQELGERQQNTYTQSELADDFPFDWEAYFREVIPEASLPETIAINGPQFGRWLELVETMPIRYLRSYLSWRLLERYHPYLTDRLESLPETNLKLVNRYFEDIIGQEYVKRHLPPETHSAVCELSEDVRRAFATRICEAVNLSSDSKERMLHKLDDIVINVGYGRNWRDYNRLEISRDNPVQNFLNLHQLSAVTQPAEFASPDFIRHNLAPGEGSQTLYTRAIIFYRKIDLPAANMAWPFYDKDASLAHNLGSIGTIIGHEFAHHFQDIQIDYSRRQNLHEAWLNPAEQKRFNEAMGKLALQLEESQAVASLKAPPRQLVRELAADLLGLQVTLDAVKKLHAPSEQQEAFRQVFQAYARKFAVNMNEEGLRAKIDHGYPEESFRVNKVLANCEEFYQAYNPQPGQRMFLAEDQRVTIW